MWLLKISKTDPHVQLNGRKDIADVTHLHNANQLLVVYLEVNLTAQRDILVVDHKETHC